MTVKPIPDGYHSVTPYLSIKGAAEAIEFYKRAFGATELFRLVAPSGEIGHAEVKIGDSPIMLADACEEGAFRNPQSLGGSSVGLHVYVEDVDGLFARAVDAGASLIGVNHRDLETFEVDPGAFLHIPVEGRGRGRTHVVEWFGQWVPRWAILDTTQGAVRWGLCSGRPGLGSFFQWIRAK